MSVLEKFNQLISPKPTYLKSNIIITNGDVLSRFLHWNLTKKFSIVESTAEALIEVLDNNHVKKIKNISKKNVVRLIKQLFADWLKCKKIAATNRKETPKSFALLKKKLECQIKIPIKMMSSENENKKNSSNINKISVDVVDDSDNKEDEKDKDFTICEKNNNDHKNKINIVTPNLVSALDRAKISSRNAVFILSASAESMGIQPEKIILNRESIRRNRIKERKIISDEILHLFKPNCALTIHWDGKKMKNSKSNRIEEHLAVHVTGEKENVFTLHIHIHHTC